MAHLLSSYPSVSRKLYTDPSSGYKLVKRGTSSNLINGRGCFDYFERERNSLQVQCCTSSTSSAEEVGLVGNGRASAINNGKGDHQLGYLVNEYGWKVRRLALKGDDMRKAAQVQAEAFHEPAPFFDDFFFHFFKAEVLSALLYKLRNSPPNRYACLVAEPISEDSNIEQEVVGAVDVTALRDRDVLELLPSDAEEYLYVSGIAVLNNFRRKKIGTALLKACDVLSILWGFEYLVLRAYEDDLGARKLYSNAGYRVVSGDPLWMTTWIGRKRRVVMIKHLNPHT